MPPKVRNWWFDKARYTIANIWVSKATASAIRGVSLATATPGRWGKGHSFPLLLNYRYVRPSIYNAIRTNEVLAQYARPGGAWRLWSFFVFFSPTDSYPHQSVAWNGWD